MKTIIKNGKLISATETIVADLIFDGEKITKIGSNLDPEGSSEVIDAEGLYVMPGGIDAHVHLDLEMAGTVSSDDHYTGTKAAAFGGTTTVIDFISQDLGDLSENVERHCKKADQKVAIDYSSHMNISHLTPEIEEQIPELIKKGITSLKVFTAYNNKLRLQDAEIFRVMRVARQYGFLTMLHAENGDLIELLVQEAVEMKHTSPIWHARTRPAWGAEEAVARGAALAAIADAPLYIVHMNAGGEVDQLEYAREKGLKVMAETCPQYLLLTQENLEKPDGAKYVCSPPLRNESDQMRLWEGLRNGSIQTIATDHCPFFFDGSKEIIYEEKPIAIPGKELGKDDFTKIPNGLPGVGDRMLVLWTKMVSSGDFSPNQFVALNCTNPARIFGMYPQKGALIPGADADIVLWDPEMEISYGVAQSQQRTDYNLYEGLKLLGGPVRVISRGRTIVNQGVWYGKPGQGRFIKRYPYGELI